MFKRFKSNDAWLRQKYPARVGHYKIGDGDWYEIWNDGTYPPTTWTKVKLFKRKIIKRPTFRTANRFLIRMFKLPIISQCIKLEELTST